jgi:hypothetical protein
MLSLFSSTLEALIFFFIAAFVIGFLSYDFADKSEKDKG